MRLLDAKKDPYRRQAKKEGYRSRSAYKLKQLNKSYRIVGNGFYVLDIGCAPGGWLQVCKEMVGEKGKLMGIDKVVVDDIPGVQIVRANVEDESIAGDVTSYFGRKVNALLCDLSPQVTGAWSVDHARQISMSYSAAKIMDKVLARKGNALFKVFDGEYTTEFRDFMKDKFIKVQLRKPLASRKPSSELYLVCLGYTG